MPIAIDTSGDSVDLAFQAWESTRQQLVESEDRWARAVTASADARSLAALQRDVADLRQSLDEVFGRAMRELERAPACTVRRGDAPTKNRPKAVLAFLLAAHPDQTA